MVSWSGEGRVALETTQVLGMNVLRAQMPSGGRWERQRLGWAARKLARQGVRRVLVPPGFEYWGTLDRWGLTGVDSLPLYRSMADQLVLAELGRRGVEKYHACVALRGEYVDADLARAARLLCPKVRALVIQVDWGGERLAWELYREFGAVAPPRVAVDAAARFGGERQPGELVLCGNPELCGLKLEVECLTLPEGLEPMPLLTALWQSGRLSLEELRVNTINFP